MKIERILFPTRFRELSFNALESLLVLKKSGLREIILAHIIPRDEVAFVPFGGYLKDEEDRLREEAKIRLEDWQRVLSDAGMESKIILRVGDPVPKILAIAENEKVDLIVAAKKKVTGPEHVFIGSATVDILRRSHIPVLVHKYMVQFEWDGEMVTRTNDRIFERPLIATDWSAPSERALKLIVLLKDVVREALVAHVISSKLAKGMERHELERLEQESRRKLEQYCKGLEDAGIKAGRHLSVGHEVQEILDMSREFNASMIVMGTTRKDLLHDFFPGGVSHRVAERSELPTLLAP